MCLRCEVNRELLPSSQSEKRFAPSWSNRDFEVSLNRSPKKNALRSRLHRKPSTQSSRASKCSRVLCVQLQKNRSGLSCPSRVSTASARVTFFWDLCQCLCEHRRQARLAIPKWPQLRDWIACAHIKNGQPVLQCAACPCCVSTTLVGMSRAHLPSSQVRIPWLTVSATRQSFHHTSTKPMRVQQVVITTVIHPAAVQ